MQITTLRAFADNYIFMLSGDAGPETAAVDPGDAEPVFRYLQTSGRPLTAILNTHHHRDHTGGNRALLERFPGIAVFGGAGDRGRIPGQTHFLVEGEEFSVCGARARVLAVPGHTKAHIAYYFSADGGGHLFSGDTVFGGTIGNLFEETPGVMFQSIQKIRRLPPETKIWCSHEYTLQYVRESAGIDPGNKRLALRLRKLEATDPSGAPTVPLTLEEERATNPFFRWDDPALAGRLGKDPGIDVFLRLCEIT
ncbi:MAG: hydroxyacylglutathione hydrolase [Acidobacteria bacterium]|nr:hydroxyacylglutathione hydrolase [Acidobacteriota bacterium]